MNLKDVINWDSAEPQTLASEEPKQDAARVRRYAKQLGRTVSVTSKGGLVVTVIQPEQEVIVELPVPAPVAPGTHAVDLVDWSVKEQVIGLPPQTGHMAELLAAGKTAHAYGLEADRIRYAAKKRGLLATVKVVDGQFSVSLSSIVAAAS